MQVLHVSSSVGRVLPVPLTACVASVGTLVDLSSCSVIAYHHSTTGLIGNSLVSGIGLTLRTAVDTSCTAALVFAGLCSACTAAAATSGLCPPGTHTFITDMVVPGGVEAGAILAMTFHVGSSLLSAEAIIRFQVISDTRGLSDAASNASGRLQTMLVSSQVCCEM
jgi:hypothetical protein